MSGRYVSINGPINWSLGPTPSMDDARVRALAGEINQRPIMKFVGTYYALSVGSAAGGFAVPSVAYGYKALRTIAGAYPEAFDFAVDFIESLGPEGVPPSGSAGELRGTVTKQIVDWLLH
jgi:hypothetical protein